MTTPGSSPFKLFFIPGLTNANVQVPKHVKRKYGWLPNVGQHTKQRKKRRKK